MTPERKKDWAALAILAALPTLLFADLLLGLNVLFTRDVAQYHYPLRHVLREIVLRGEFPFWNPWIAAGQPLAANPAYQVFYPLTWLILLPSFKIGFHLHVLAHVFIATFGLFALLRSMRVGRTAAVLAALSFGLGGLVTSTLNLFPFLFSIAWIPWICLYARRALRGGGRRDFAFAACFLALQLLVSEPTTTLQTGVLLGLYAIFRGNREAIARRLAIVAALCAVATLLAAVQLVPAVDHFRDSIRAHGIPFEMVSKWSMPPVRIAELINPQLLGNPLPNDVREYWGVGVYQGSWKPFFYCIYSGLLIVVGVVVGLVTRKRGSVLYLVCATLSFIAAIGVHTPLLALAYEAGVANAIRYAEKFAILGVFASIVFAARAIDDVIRGDRPALRVARISAIAILSAAGALALLGFTPLWEPLFRRVWLVPDAYDLSAMLPIAQTTWSVAAARALGLALLLLAATRMQPMRWRVLLGLFVVADVASLVPRIAPRVAAAYYDVPPALRQASPQRDDYRLYHLGDDFPSAKSDPYFRPQPDGAWLVRNALTGYAPVTHGFRIALGNDLDLTSLAASDDFSAALAELAERAPNRWLGPAVAMSNVRYVIVYRDPKVAFAEARGVVRDVRPVDLTFVGENPRYWFAREVVSIRDRQDFVAHLQQAPYTRGKAFIQAPVFAPGAAIIHRVRETTQSASIDVEARGPAFLVMSVTPHKDWRITIDGVETAAVLTNIGYQGVLVPGGRHEVRMRYSNPLIAVGAALSIASLLALVVFVRRRVDIDAETRRE